MEEILQAASEDAYRRPGAVSHWCGKHRKSIRELALRGRPWEKRFARRMTDLFRQLSAIVEELAELQDRERIETEAAGQEFHESEEPEVFDGLDFDDGEPLRLDDLTVEQAGMVGWALA
jgi:hypothetical protein